MSIIAIIVALVLLVVVCTFINRSHGKPTFIFGGAVLWVETGSMEPCIPERSYVFVKKSNGANLNVGDVITFKCEDETSPVYGELITHRIVEVTENGYKTKGDASAPDKWTVSPSSVYAIYVKNLPVFTVAGRIFASPVGLILICVLFLWSCVFIYIPDVISALKSEEKKDKKQGLSDAEIDAEVQKRVKEMLENPPEKGD